MVHIVGFGLFSLLPKWRGIQLTDCRHSHSQEAQNTDEWLKFIWSILMDPLAPVDLMEAKLQS